MPRYPLRWSPLATVAGLLLTAGALTGCPGSLDPSLMGEPPATGTGGSNGTGGMNGSGGSPGSGGSNVDCSGSNDGAMIVSSQCLVCHGASTAVSIGGGLDLTIDANIKSRLVGVKPPGTAASSKCSGQTMPYLNANSMPATGLLIDKVQKSTPECGDQMPQGNPLSSIQQQCLIKWATTLTSGTQ